MPGEGELNEPETSNGALFRSRSGRRRDLCSAEGHGVASLDSPGATHLSIHADVDFVVACRCAQDPAVLREISLRKCGHDAARTVVGDREHDVVADPKFSPHPSGLHELGVIVLGTHDDVGPEAPDLEAALRVELSQP